MYEWIAICCVNTVALTQMIKNFMDDGNILTKATRTRGKGWMWTLLTIIIAVANVLIYERLPYEVTQCLMVISISSLFYDLIYKGMGEAISAFIARLHNKPTNQPKGNQPTNQPTNQPKEDEI